MTKYKRIVKNISEEDYNICMFAYNIRLLNKLRKNFPSKNIFIVTKYGYKKLDYKDTKTYILLVSKSRIKELEIIKENWKKVIVY